MGRLGAKPTAGEEKKAGSGSTHSCDAEQSKAHAERWKQISLDETALREQARGGVGRHRGTRAGTGGKKGRAAGRAHSPPWPAAPCEGAWSGCGGGAARSWGPLHRAYEMNTPLQPARRLPPQLRLRGHGPKTRATALPRRCEDQATPAPAGEDASSRAEEQQYRSGAWSSTCSPELEPAPDR